ncbi:ATP-binding protein, partial [Anaerolineales bacterium HSG24]|nr:ATP-binding protein [Anaerolineales bacterium HSG24]
YTPAKLLLGYLNIKMSTSPQKFSLLLTEAVHKIRIEESKHIKKTIRIIQDELGYALGREGGTSIEYWRKGYVPASLIDLENLARELVRRGGLTESDAEQLLRAADHPYPSQFIATLFPDSEHGGTERPPLLLESFAPFVIGPPIAHPCQFFGRERTVKRIFNLWKRLPLQNVAIVGLHRSGKTSLLRYLSQITTTLRSQLRPKQRNDWLPQPELYQWVFVDFQDARMGDQTRLLTHILNELHLPIPNPCDLNNFMDVVSDHLQYPAIIMMDEIGAGLAAPDLNQQFWWSLRSLGSNYSRGKLGFILTAPDTPALLAQEHGKPSPFFNIFGHIVTLKQIDEPAARDLLASSPQPFPSEVVTWMLEQSSRWPALLQILADTYLTALEDGEVNETWQAEGLKRLAQFEYLRKGDTDKRGYSRP